MSKINNYKGVLDLVGRIETCPNCNSKLTISVFKIKTSLTEKYCHCGNFDVDYENTIRRIFYNKCKFIFKFEYFPFDVTTYDVGCFILYNVPGVVFADLGGFNQTYYEILTKATNEEFVKFIDNIMILG